jgi:cytochrome P450
VEPDLISFADEDFLRYECSNQLDNRLVARDTIVGRVEMPKDTYIHLCVGAANCNPPQFPYPERLDIKRHPNRHLRRLCPCRRASRVALRHNV